MLRITVLNADLNRRNRDKESGVRKVLREVGATEVLQFQDNAYR